MSILQSYPLGNPTAKDYVIGTKIPPADTDEKPTTNNFSVASIASFANSYSLGYTVYTAALVPNRYIGSSGYSTTKHYRWNIHMVIHSYR